MQAPVVSILAGAFFVARDSDHADSSRLTTGQNDGCAATISADTTVTLVRPTAGELHEHAGEEVEAAA